MTKKHVYIPSTFWQNLHTQGPSGYSVMSSKMMHALGICITGFFIFLATANSGYISALAQADTVETPQQESFRDQSGVSQDVPTGNVVFFGDSFVADTTLNQMRLNKLKLVPEFGINAEQETLPFHRRCTPDPRNYAALIGQRFNVDTADYSCNGLSMEDTIPLVDLAIAEGALTSNTRSVVIQAGGKDVDGSNDATFMALAFRIDSLSTNPEKFLKSTRTVVEKIRAISPHATIIIPGYLQISSHDNVCFLNLTEHIVYSYPLKGFEQLEIDIAASQKYVSDQLNLTFVDMYQLSQGHGTCDPNKNTRMVAGVIDSAEHNIMIHPTTVGKNLQVNVIGPLAAAIPEI